MFKKSKPKPEENLTLVEYCDKLENIVVSMAVYFYNEMGWENFRNEIFEFDKGNESASYKNAMALEKFMREICDIHPEIKKLISEGVKKYNANN